MFRLGRHLLPSPDCLSAGGSSGAAWRAANTWNKQVTPRCLYTGVDVGTERQPAVSETAAKAAGDLSVDTVRLVEGHVAEKPYRPARKHADKFHS